MAINLNSTPSPSYRYQRHSSKPMKRKTKNQLPMTKGVVKLEELIKTKYKHIRNFTNKHEIPYDSCRLVLALEKAPSKNLMEILEKLDIKPKWFEKIIDPTEKNGRYGAVTAMATHEVEATKLLQEYFKKGNKITTVARNTGMCCNRLQEVVKGKRNVIDPDLQIKLSENTGILLKCFKTPVEPTAKTNLNIGSSSKQLNSFDQSCANTEIANISLGYVRDDMRDVTVNYATAFNEKTDYNLTCVEDDSLCQLIESSLNSNQNEDASLSTQLSDKENTNEINKFLDDMFVDQIDSKADKAKKFTF